MPNFDFFEKAMEISPPHFVYELPRKVILMLCSIN